MQFHAVILLAVSAITAMARLSCSNHERGEGMQERFPGVEEQSWIAGPAGKLFVDRGGKSLPAHVPVVFVHSLAGNTTQWQAQLQYVRQSRFAAAFDLRGHGQSELALDHDYSLGAMARDLDVVLDSLGWSQAVLVGHSFGGGVIAVYASQHPTRVAGLFFVDAIGDSRQIPAEELAPWLAALHSDQYAEMIAAHWRNILVHADSGVAQQVLSDLRRTPKEAVLGALDSMLTYNPATMLQAYYGPWQALASGLPDDPSALHHVIPNLPVINMPGTSHWLQMDRPGEFNRHLEEFLARVDTL